MMGDGIGARDVNYANIIRRGVVAGEIQKHKGNVEVGLEEEHLHFPFMC